MLKKLKQIFCFHEYQTDIIKSNSSISETTWYCSKCGKRITMEEYLKQIAKDNANNNSNKYL